MNALVTVCTESYAPLASLWLERMKQLTQLPIFVVCVGDWTYDFVDATVILADAPTNPFPAATPDHACAEKLRVFRHLPKEIDQVLFVDTDIMVINSFWNDDLFASSQTQLMIVPDHFVGYKEKIEDEFRPFDPAFKMKFLPTGEYFYFNTGVFFASRQAHESRFEECLEVWRSYVKTLGRLPSVFDQNVFNYYLISRGVGVSPLPLQNNCLRQYSHVIKEGRLFLDNLPVNAFHFNGGEGKIKLERWLQLQRLLGGTT